MTNSDMSLLEKTAKKTAKELDEEKISRIINPPNKDEVFETTFSVHPAFMLELERELKPHHAVVTGAVKENSGNWLLSVRAVV